MEPSVPTGMSWYTIVGIVVGVLFLVGLLLRVYWFLRGLFLRLFYGRKGLTVTEDTALSHLSDLIVRVMRFNGELQKHIPPIQLLILSPLAAIALCIITPVAGLLVYANLSLLAPIVEFIFNLSGRPVSFHGIKAAPSAFTVAVIYIAAETLAGVVLFHCTPAIREAIHRALLWGAPAACRDIWHASHRAAPQPGAPTGRWSALTSVIALTIAPLVVAVLAVLFEMGGNGYAIYEATRGDLQAAVLGCLVGIIVPSMNIISLSFASEAVLAHLFQLVLYGLLIVVLTVVTVALRWALVPRLVPTLAVGLANRASMALDGLNQAFPPQAGNQGGEGQP